MIRVHLSSESMYIPPVTYGIPTHCYSGSPTFGIFYCILVILEALSSYHVRHFHQYCPLFFSVEIWSPVSSLKVYKKGERYPGSMPIYMSYLRRESLQASTLLGIRCVEYLCATASPLPGYAQRIGTLNLADIAFKCLFLAGFLPRAIITERRLKVEGGEN